jgi:hypothetical protein
MLLLTYATKMVIFSSAFENDDNSLLRLRIIIAKMTKEQELTPFHVDLMPTMLDFL